MKDKNRGIYDKFRVSRTDGTSRQGKKHHGCQYFVFDMTHDPGAKPALLAYIEWAEANGYGALAYDLRQKVEAMP